MTRSIRNGQSYVRSTAYLESKENSQRVTLPKIVSLFCGAGGLDWGFHRLGFKISVAVDKSFAAIQTHKRNFSNVHGVAADLIALGPNGLLPIVQEQVPSGEHIGVIGGPPCQGFSLANARSRADDPRNKLPSLYLNIIHRLQQYYTIDFVVFENVPGMRSKKHIETYKAFIDELDSLDFDVSEKELCAIDYGVPQNRRRIVISAMRRGQGYSEVRLRKRKGLSTVRDAIGRLAAPAFFARNLLPTDIPIHPNHWTMNPKSPRFSDPENGHLDGRSFKRLSWLEPSPTIAFGHREIHIHPNGKRRLSIYEAMLLQGFPSDFILEGNLSEQVEQISNAVPPPLARCIAAAVKRSLQGK
jgi:DNA (cytosine-5)-methyltransferase 1